MSDEPRKPVLRIPRFSMLAPIGGWLAAWGAATLATAAVLEAGVSLGFGFGIADGSVDLDTGFWAGLWTLVIQAGAFVVGGYVAGRIARVRPVMHAVLAWVIAMAATAADAILVALRDSGSSVLAPLRLPPMGGPRLREQRRDPARRLRVGWPGRRARRRVACPRGEPS